MSHSAMNQPLVTPNQVLGILGGGQLGRMLAMAAAQLGIRVHIFCPEPDCPAAEVASFHTCADYLDELALTQWAKTVAAVTYEFENVPAKTVGLLMEIGVPVAPNARSLEIAQDRIHEKQFVESLGAGVAPYYPVDDLESLSAGLETVGTPAILKTRRLGYDGKGQTRLHGNEENLSETWEAAKRYAWQEIGAQPAILEAFQPFVCEISVIAARGWSGEMALYDVSENQHRDGILHRSMVPATVSDLLAQKARGITCDMLENLDYVGVVGVEFFIMEDGRVLVNEFAPRVHNSGHWTLDGCAISQFEQQIRAVCGWPLGDTTRHSDAEMINLIGDEANGWLSELMKPGANLHLYGKTEARSGRKMGHVTITKPQNGRAP